MEGHSQCSRLVGRGEWRGIDSAQASWKGGMEGHRQCSRLVGRVEWRGIDSAHS